MLLPQRGALSWVFTGCGVCTRASSLPERWVRTGWVQGFSPFLQTPPTRREAQCGRTNSAAWEHGSPLLRLSLGPDPSRTGLR